MSLLSRGGFSATKTKVSQNRLKWIDPKSKNFPSSWGGGFSAKVLVSKLKFDQMYIYLLEMTELCIKKHFEDVKIPYLVLNSK